MYAPWRWRKRPEVQVHPHLHIEFKACLVYTRHCVNKHEHTKNIFWTTPSAVLVFSENLGALYPHLMLIFKFIVGG